MARPQKRRIVSCDPSANYFKPRGIPLHQIEEVRLTIDQMEAIRLADLEGLSQQDAGKKMGVSRATFGRIVQSARKIVAEALVQGKAILLEGGNCQLDVEKRRFGCQACNFIWEGGCGTGRPEKCPKCGHKVVGRI